MLSEVGLLSAPGTIRSADGPAGRGPGVGAPLYGRPVDSVPVPDPPQPRPGAVSVLAWGWVAVSVVVGLHLTISAVTRSGMARELDVVCSTQLDTQQECLAARQRADTAERGLARLVRTAGAVALGLAAAGGYGIWRARRRPGTARSPGRRAGRGESGWQALAWAWISAWVLAGALAIAFALEGGTGALNCDMPGALCDAARAEHEAETRRPGVVAAVLGPALPGSA